VVDISSPSGTIAQDTWLTIIVRYDASTRAAEMRVDGAVVGTATASAALADRTVTKTYVGKSEWGSDDAYLNADMAGLNVADQYLDLATADALADAMETSGVSGHPGTCLACPAGTPPTTDQSACSCAEFTCSGNCPCDYTITSASGGRFSDGSGSSNYANSLVCSWLIAASGSISVQFPAFATESGWDYVTINACPSADCSSPVQLSRLSGTVQSSAAFTSSTGFLQVVFTSQSYSCVTTNGNVASGTPCSFPFEYNGQTFSECTSQDYHTLWCSTTPVFTGEWGECSCYTGQSAGFEAEWHIPACSGLSESGEGSGSGSGADGCTNFDDWADSIGDNCADYEANPSWCQDASDYADGDGVDATTACSCVCGGFIGSGSGGGSGSGW